MARPSAIYRSSQPSSITRNRYQFPLLSIPELVSLCSKMKLDITEEMILKPTKPFMQSLIEQVMDKFLFVSPYSLRQNIEKIETNEDNEVNGTQNTMNIVANQRIMFQFLSDCGFDDFSIRDVLKPESARVKLILSSLINYARFREERLDDCLDLFSSNENLMNDYREESKLNHNIKLNINEIENKLVKNDLSLEKIELRSNEVQNELKNLTEVQQKLATEHSDYKVEKDSLIKELENQNSLLLETRKELDRIKPFIKESPEVVLEIINNLKNSLKLEETNLINLDTKLKNTNISIDSFKNLYNQFNDINNGAIVEFEDDLNKLKEINNLIDLSNLKIEKNEVEINNLNRSISQSEKYLESNRLKLTNLKATNDSRLSAMKQKIEQSKDQIINLKMNVENETKELENKKSQIEAWKKSIVEIESRFDKGCQTVSVELSQLNKHVLMYISEMNKKLDEQMGSM